MSKRTSIDLTPHRVTARLDAHEARVELADHVRRVRLLEEEGSTVVRPFDADIFDPNIFDAS